MFPRFISVGEHSDQSFTCFAITITAATKNARCPTYLWAIPRISNRVKLLHHRIWDSLVNAVSFFLSRCDSKFHLLICRVFLDEINV